MPGLVSSPYFLYSMYIVNIYIDKLQYIIMMYMYIHIYIHVRLFFVLQLPDGKQQSK